MNTTIDTNFNAGIIDALAPADHAHEAWRVTDLHSADWAARKAATYRNKITSIEAVAKAQVEQIQAWATAEREKLENDAEYFEGHLHQYLLEQRRNEADSGTPEAKQTKTIKLPGGAQIKARSLPIKAAVTDEEAFLKWVTANDRTDLIRTKISPALTPIRDAVTKDGEVIDGVDIIESELRISVTHAPDPTSA